MSTLQSTVHTFIGHASGIRLIKLFRLRQHNYVNKENEQSSIYCKCMFLQQNE